MSKGLYSLTFILGAAVGSVVTWYLVKDKYEKLADEEIESVKEVFSKRAADAKKSENIEDPETEKKPEGKHMKTKPNIMEYAAKLSEIEGYINYAKEEPAVTKVEPDELPYIISPDSYDDEEDYDKVSYIYYADGVLADETDEIVEDGTVPDDFADHFGEYEKDTVYVRDDALKVDYDICRDDRSYEEVVGHKPPRVEIK